MALDISATLTRAWSIDDHGMHTPTAEKLFQESVYFNFNDPRSGVGGEYRLGMHPNLGTANLYAWTQVGGTFADKRFRENLPLPDGPLNDACMEGLAFSTIEPLKAYRITNEQPGLKVDLTWTAFTGPLPLTLNLAGATVAAKHYNCFGHVTGRIERGGDVVEVDCDGFMDHSWGERGVHPSAARWILAEFGPECFVMALALLVDPVTYVCGYIAIDGKLRALTNDLEFNMGIREDWLTPSSCDARMVDEDGRAFRLTGRTVGPSSSWPYSNGLVATRAMAEFELGGRIGRGLLECCSPVGMLPSLVREYGLDPEGMWVK